MILKCNCSRSHIFRVTLFYLLGAVLFASGGCKVSYSFTGASTEGLKTISVLYFQNRASLVQPTLSQYITDELISKCKAQTKLSFVSDAGDAGFEGDITDYNTVPLTVAGDATAAMNRFTISVRVKFTNLVNPDLSYEQVFTRYEDYDSTKDLSQVEQQLTEKIVDLLVEDIFNKAFTNW